MAAKKFIVELDAKVLRDLSDIHLPKAEKIVLVQDNLNSHTPASLYEAFEPAEARRIVVSAEDYDALVRAIESPPEPNERLKELMRRKPLWEQ